MRQRNSMDRFATLASLMTAMALSQSGDRPSGTRPTARVIRGKPWDRINLTKAERRGKTYEEIQAMRRERWEAVRGQA